MYKRKYYKYKYKYLILKGGGDFTQPIDDPDIVDFDEETQLYPIENEDMVDTTVDLGELEEEDNEKFAQYRNSYEGFNEFLSENLQQIIVDVGTFGKARGKRYTIDDFEESDFIYLKDKSNKDKILRITSLNDFDQFTDKYGQLHAINDDNINDIYIEWGKIADEYRGVYITSSVLQGRDHQIPYKNKTVNNWVNTDPNWNNREYNFLDEVVLFVRERPAIFYREIIEPFKGNVADPYAINEKEIATIDDKITYDKVLIINDVESFDKFTNKYGIVKDKFFKKYDKYVKFIDIDWNKVNIDYMGFYIDKDNNFKDDRYRYAFFSDDKLRSWWKTNKINQGVVYLFA